MSLLRITILGVGLIGGSLGLAFKQGAVEDIEITGVDSDPDSLALALKQGSVDKITTDPVVGTNAADVIFICTPVLQIPQLVEKILPHLKAGAILTDVGSTKGFLKRQIAAGFPPDIFYIGGHPMAGREKSGVAAADGNLFQGKVYILTPDETTSPAALELVTRLAQLTGARVTVMDVDSHDLSAAVISHVPHVVAAGLVSLLGSYHGKEQSFLELAGGGFCDTTRIASSNADMWADICLTNGKAISEGLDQMQLILNAVSQAIERGDRDELYAFFSAAKLRRDSIIASI